MSQRSPIAAPQRRLRRLPVAAARPLGLRLAVTSVLMLGALASAAGASAATVIGEQLDRGTGINGGSALDARHPGFTATAGAISSDGRFSYFTYSSPGLPAAQAGIYVRDIQANTTALLFPGGSSPVLSDAGTVLSFSTKSALDPADTNSAADVYLYNTVTKAVTLGSRSGGPGSSAVGGSGRVTPDGKAVYWSAAAGSAGRFLSGGASFALLPASAGQIVGSSDDGRTLVAGVTTTTSAGYTSIAYGVYRDGKAIAQPALTPGLSREASGSLYLGPPLVSGDGNTVLWHTATTADGGETRSLAVDTVSSGTVRVITPPIAVTPLRVSADGSSATATAACVIGSVNLTTGATAQTSGALPACGGFQLSSNGQFAQIGDSWGHLFAIPTGTLPLPGTVDPPSPLAFMAFNDGCLNTDGFTGRPTEPPSIDFRTQGVGLLPSALDVTLTSLSSGKVVKTAHLVGGASFNATSWGNFKITVKSSYPDGRTATDSAPIAAYTPFSCGSILSF